MDLLRVVEIFCNYNGKCGSGYLISNRLVLTAGHVVERAPDSAVCDLNLLDPKDAHGRQRQFKAAQAKVCWRSQEHDAALLEVIEPSGGIPDLPPEPVQFGRVPQNGEVFDCAGTGFPDAQHRDGVTGNRHLSGQLSWVIRHGLFDLDVTNHPPGKVKGWSGFSGTAIFVTHALVGVVMSVSGWYDRRVLKATPVETIFGEPSFHECLRRFGHAVDTPAFVSSRKWRSVASRVARYKYLIDRRPQMESITERVGEWAQSFGSPLMFLVHGHANQLHELLIERIARESCVRDCLKRDADPRSMIIRINWPSEFSINAEAKFRGFLCNNLAKALCLPPLKGDAADILSLLDALRRSDRPLAFWSYLELQHLGPGHGELLRLWLNLWRDAGDIPVLLFLCIGFRENKDERPGLSSIFPFLDRDRKPDPIIETVLSDAVGSGQLQSLDDLRDIDRTDVAPWLADVHLLCGDIAQDDMDDFRGHAEAKVGDGIDMRTFCDHLSSISEAR